MSEMNFEEKSFINMVNFWSEELRRIIQGESVKTIFPMKKRSNLVGKEILVVKGLPSPKHYEVHEKAIQVLRDLENNGDEIK